MVWLLLFLLAKMTFKSKVLLIFGKKFGKINLFVVPLKDTHFSSLQIFFVSGSDFVK
jgi:hypothetical protein